ncbi:hypothetical protein [Armatimonas rosea]|uniref:Uncharacterized protein n=1 Tax=Armatimonas rosea TaxID=685828 RepID=A0A7W9W3G2_ARMRO|nr:hypothetical protein [Armatimonas rosea]MBB6048379.1 hypothetical protein [Armatimonas rosea]
MSRDRFSTPVWVLTGLFRSAPGTLELVQGRLRLLSGGETVFDVPRESLNRVYFPWYYFGAGVKLTLEAKTYRLSFVEPGENGDLVRGCAAGKSWKNRLRP